MIDSDRVRELVTKAQAGDREAFDALAQAYESRLRSRLESWSQLRIGPRVDLDELLQDALVRAFRGVHGFEWKGDDSFFRWLCGVAKNTLADSARKARREAQRRADGFHLSGVAAENVSQSRALRREERFDRLEEAFDRLPPDYRDALKLARLEGLTVKEIAKKLDRTPRSVKHLIARGLRELKKIFGDTESLHLPDRLLNPKERTDDE